jgi:hypothetical protein
MSDNELEAVRRDLAAGLGFMPTSNGMYGPATAFLNAVNAEIAQRAIWEAP